MEYLPSQESFAGAGITNPSKSLAFYLFRLGFTPFAILKVS
jgi:hypothetical protein